METDDIQDIPNVAERNPLDPDKPENMQVGDAALDAATLRHTALEIDSNTQETSYFGRPPPNDNRERHWRNVFQGMQQHDGETVGTPALPEEQKRNRIIRRGNPRDIYWSQVFQANATSQHTTPTYRPRSPPRKWRCTAMAAYVPTDNYRHAEIPNGNKSHDAEDNPDANLDIFNMHEDSGRERSRGKSRAPGHRRASNEDGNAQAGRKQSSERSKEARKKERSGSVSQSRNGNAGQQRARAGDDNLRTERGSGCPNIICFQGRDGGGGIGERGVQHLPYRHLQRPLFPSADSNNTPWAKDQSDELAPDWGGVSKWGSKGKSYNKHKLERAAK